jgi:hypothetical protein
MGKYIEKILYERKRLGVVAADGTTDLRGLLLAI